MIKATHNILGLIPARGGSKGIPNKNIIHLNGKPLIAYSIFAAQNSQLLSKAIVSTDDEKIASIATDLKIPVPFLRPNNLAQDSSGAIGVIEHAIDFYKNKKEIFDFIVYLQPTSPLRLSSDIDNAIKLITNSKADSLVSVMDVPHQFSIQSLMQEKVNESGSWLENNDSIQVLSRQEKAQYVARNGPAILITKPETIINHQSLYGDKVLSYKMPQSRSVDIDEQDDLDYASWLLKKHSAD